MSKIQILRDLHQWWNEEEFDGLLRLPVILCKRSNWKDGYYSYRGRKDWTPVISELHSAYIVVADGCFDEGTEEETLVHEMIHQWQAEVLKQAPHHNEVFDEKKEYIQQKYNMVL